MIVKMKFINITGPKNDIDRVTDLYLSRYEIQLESAMSELKTTDTLRPFVEVNPYRDALLNATSFVGYLKDADKITPAKDLGLDDMFEVIRDANHDYMEYQDEKNELKKKRESLYEKQRFIAPFRPLDFELQEVFSYRYIQYRFGKLPLEYHHKLEKYLMDDLGVIFMEGERDESFVYGVCFYASEDSQKVDAILRGLHFEKITLPTDFSGTPSHIYHELEKKIVAISHELEEIDDKVGDMLATKGPKLLAAKNRFEELSKNFDVRKMAARVKDQKEDFYILCGWMAGDDVDKFLKEIEDDDKVFVVVEDEADHYFGESPTKLKNAKVLKPFEMFTEMYGLPSANEMDPTLFLALTYPFIFGVMFGDVGQGLCLLLGGALIYWRKRIPLAGIISAAGVFSTIFGFMFGSFFGFEDVIEPLWLRPIDHMTTLPFIGKLNTVFIVAVAFGMFVILIAMILHIINGLRSHDTADTLFDANGVAGLVFYGAIVATIFLFMTGHQTPATWVMVIMFGIPLLLILLKEPLTNRLEKKKETMKEGIGMFLVQGFFELFEMLLSYFSNTLSFVRIGAFAVSHAAMMEVVLMLAGAETGNPNWVVIVLGNLFVCGMEGLIVGIQVLRLEYYEMFSRFYKGTGRAFTPYNKKIS